MVTKDGKPVTDLHAQDFEIFEDGKPQTISNFSYVPNGSGNVATPSVPARNTKDVSVPVPPAKMDPKAQKRIVAMVIDDLGISFENTRRAV